MNTSIKIPKLDSCLKWGLLFLMLKILLAGTKIDNVIPYLDDILTALTVFLLSIVILKKKFNYKILLIHIVLFVLGMYTSYQCKNITIFIPLLAICSIREEKNNIYFILKYELIVILLIVIGSIFTGSNIGVYSIKSARYLFKLGFMSANILGCVCYNLLTMWIWCDYKKINPNKLITYFFLFILIYIVSGSKTVLIMGFVTTILIVLSFSKKESINKLLTLITQSIVPILSISFYYLISRYDETKRIIVSLNDFLTGRIKLGAYAYYKYGTTLFGQFVDIKKNFGWDAEWQMKKIRTFDNLYTSFLVNYGIIWLILISVAFFLLARKRNNQINCMLIIWAMYGITEIHGLSGFMGFPIFLTALLLERKSYQRDDIDI